MSGLAPPAPISYPALTRTDLVRYAGASGDFNPLHHDARSAAAAGLPDVMAHGMLSAGLLASALTRWFGPGCVRRFQVRFLHPVWPGDVLSAHCRGIAQAGQGSAELSLELVRGDGVAVLSGSARVALPPPDGGASEGP